MIFSYFCRLWSIIRTGRWWIGSFLRESCRKMVLRGGKIDLGVTSINQSIKTFVEKFSRWPSYDWLSPSPKMSQDGKIGRSIKIEKVSKYRHVDQSINLDENNLLRSQKTAHVQDSRLQKTKTSKGPINRPQYRSFTLSPTCKTKQLKNKLNWRDFVTPSFVKFLFGFVLLCLDKNIDGNL